MRILVTGGCGFIGSNYVLSQIDQHQVLNIDKLTYAGNIENLSTISNKLNYSFLKGDICDAEFISSSINNFEPDFIVHFAAESHVDRSIEKPDEFIRSNIVGVFNILEYMKEFFKKNKKFKMVHISTDEVFGNIKKNKTSSENDKYEPSSPYSASKASADHLINSYI